jgi:vacuolar-type H+-ATPase subunit H
MDGTIELYHVRWQWPKIYTEKYDNHLRHAAKNIRLVNMAKSDTKTQSQKDEFSRIFDEYRAKIEEISRKTVKSTPQSGTASDTTAGDELEDMEVTVSRLQPKKALKSADLISLVDIEAEETILAAKRRAQQIIDEAEEKSKKEASKKTQSQVEKIIGKAKKDAEEVIEQARQATEKESNDIVAAAKQEAEQLIREITEKCRRETQAQSNRAIDRAREKADKMMTEIIISCQGISLMANEIVNKARQTIDEFEAKLQQDISTLAKAIAEAQQKLQEFTVIAQKEKEEVISAPANKSTIPMETPTLSVRVLGTKSNGHDGTQPLFSGQVEMKSISASFDYQYLKNLKRYLVHIPNINYLQEYASEKEISILFELTEPLPLLEILRNIPMVDEVNADTDDISIVFKNPR